MQLTYKGIQYTRSSQTVETVETDVTCQFLGRKAKMRVAKRLPANRTANQLKYRGASYTA